MKQLIIILGILLAASGCADKKTARRRLGLATLPTLNMTGLTHTFTLAETFGFCPADDVCGHLGSVRAIIDGDTGTAIEANDYYPFGKRIPLPVSGAVPVTEPVEVTRTLEVTVASTSSATATGSATSQNRWHFSGKESQSFLSASIPLLDFGARMYGPLTARWTAQDPLAEKYYAISPYAYCSANPVIIVDPDGLTWKSLFYNGEYVGYEWISNDDAYKNGQLKDGYHEIRPQNYELISNRGCQRTRVVY